MTWLTLAVNRAYGPHICHESCFSNLTVGCKQVYRTIWMMQIWKSQADFLSSLFATFYQAQADKCSCLDPQSPWHLLMFPCREILNHRCLMHPHVVQFKEVHQPLPAAIKFLTDAIEDIRFVLSLSVFTVTCKLLLSYSTQYEMTVQLLKKFYSLR